MVQSRYMLLFVDNSSEDVELIATRLEHRAQLEFSYQQVDTTKDLSAALQSQNWDLVICNFVMPRLDAKQVLEICQDYQPGTPLYLIGGKASMIDVVDMMRLGVRAFVEKTDYQRLIELVQQELVLVSAKKQVIETENYYQNIVNLQTELICRFDKDLRILYANQAYYDWKGITTDEELIGKPIMDSIPDKDRHRAYAHIRSLSPENPVAVSIHPSILPDNTRRVIEWTDRAIFDDKGEIIEYQGVGRDVTEREQNARELATLSDNLRSILDTMQDALVSISFIDQKILYESSSFEEIFGYPYAQFRDNKDFYKSVVHPDDIEGAIEAQKKCLRDGYVEFDHRILHPSGETRWIQRRAWVNYDSERRPIRVNDSARDITAQKHAQQSLRESEELYRLTLSNISDAVFITDDDGNFTFVCPNVHIIYGFDEQEALAIGHISRFVDNDLFDRAELSRLGEMSNLECVVTDKSGRQVTVLVSVKSIEIGRGTILYTVHDISERKKAQDALRVSEARLTKAQAVAHVGHWDWNIVTGDLYWSDETYRLFGFEPHKIEPTYSTILECIHPDDREAVGDMVQNAVAEHGLFSIDHRIVLPNGEPRIVHEEGEIIYDDNGNPSHVLGIIQDITQQSIAEQSIRESEARLAEAQRLAHLGSWEHDLIDDVLYWSDEVYRIFGIDKGTTPAHIDVFYGALPEDDAKMVKDAVKQALRDKTHFEIDHRIIRPDGEIRIVHEHSETVYNDDGDPIKMVGTVQDVTQRRKMEASLRDSEARYRNLVQQTPNGILIHQNDIIEFINPAGAKILGGTQDTEVLGRSIYDFIVEEDIETVKDRTRMKLDGQDVAFVERRIRRLDGQLIYVEVTGTVTEFNATPAVQVVFWDITDRKLAAQQLREREQSLQSLINSQTNYVVRTDLDGYHTYTNPKFEREYAWIFGDDGLEGGYGLDSIMDYHHERCMEAVNDCLTEPGKIVMVELDKPRRDGDIRTTLWEVICLTDEDGQPTEIQCMGIDITDIRQAETKVIESNERYKSLVNSSDSAIILVNYDGDILYANDEYRRRSQSDDNGSLSDIYSQEAAQRRLDVVRKVIDTESDLLYEIEDHDSQVGHWYRASLQPVRDGTGKVIAALINSLDITKRKKQELALQESERRFRIVSRLMSDIAIEFRQSDDDKWAKVWELGTNLDELLGYESGQLLLEWESYIHPDDLSSVQQAVKQTLNGQQTADEYRIRDASGSYRWFASSRAPVVDDTSQQIIGYMLALKDITDRKEADFAIRESEQRLRIVSELLSDSAQQFDIDETREGTISWSIGRKLPEMLGYDNPELNNFTRLLEVVHPDDVDGHWAAIEQTLSGQETSNEFRMLDTHGKYRWFNGSRRPLWNADHTKVESYIVALKDITEQKDAELALRQSEQRFKIISELMSDNASQFHVDEDGSVTRLWEVGVTTDSILGYDSNQFINVNTGFGIVHPDEREEQREAVQRTLQGHETSNEFRLRASDGTYRWFFASRKPMHTGNDAKVTDYVLALKDITDRKTAELALRQSETRFRLVSELMSDTAIEYVFDDEGNSKRVWRIGHDIGDLLGYGPNKFLTPQIVTEHIHPDDLQSVQNAIEKTRQGARNQSEHRMKTSDGDYKWFACSRQPIFDHQTNKVTGYMLAMNDITNQKHTLEALQASDTRFKQFMSHLPASTFIQTEDAHVVYCNDLYATETGLAIEAIIDHPTRGYLGEDGETIILEENKAVLKADKALRFNYIQVHEQSKHWDLIKFPIPQPSGKSLIGGIAVDVTDRENAMIALEASEKRYRQMFEKIRLPQLILESDTGVIIDANPAAVATYGYTYENLIGMNIDQINQTPLTDIRAKLKEINAGKRDSCNCTQVFADGTIIEVEIFLGDIQWGDRTAIYSVFIDVTQRNRAERDLKQLNETLEHRVAKRTSELEAAKSQIEAVFNNSSDGILLFDLHDGILKANHTCDVMFGTRFEDYANQPLSSIFVSEDHPTVDALIKTVIDSGISEQAELRLTLGDSGHFYAEVTIAVIPKTDDSPLQMVCTIHDVTERKQAELVIAEERNLLRTIIDTIPIAIYVKDLQLRHTLVNQYLTRQYDEDVIGKTDHDLSEIESAKHFAEEERLILETGQPLLDTLRKSVAKDGDEEHEIWHYITKVPLYNTAGDAIGIVGANYDVTQLIKTERELRDSEQQLRESQNMLRLILDTIPVRVFWKDQDSVYLGANELFIQDANLSSVDEIIGKDDNELFPTEASLYRNDDHQVITSGNAQIDYEESRTTDDGTVTWRQTSKIPLRNVNGEIIGVLGTYTDITERKKAEEQLRFLANIQRVMSDAVVSASLDSTILTWNPAAEKLYGWIAEEAIGESISDILVPNMNDGMTFEGIRAELMQYGVWSGEIMHNDRNGNPILCLSSVVINRNEQGKPIGIIAVNRDITERKKAQDEIAVSEARYRLLAENTSDVIMRHSLDGLITYVSPSVYELIGYQSDEVIGRVTVEFIFPEDIAQNPIWDVPHNDRPPSYVSLYRLMHKEGHLVWVETTSTHVFENDTIIDVVSVTRDVSERMTAEAELRSLTQRLELATNAAEIGVWDWNPVDNTLIWDEQMMKIYGIQPEDFDGNFDTWLERVYPDDMELLQVAIQETIDHSTPYSVDFRVIVQDGALRHVQFSSVMVRDGNGNPQRIVGVNIDITDLKEADRALRSALEREKELGELKSRFVSMASHELRTPLAGIMATVETLTRFRSKMNENQIDERIGKIRQQVDRLKDIMDDVLNLSRLQSGRIEFKPETAHFDKLIEDIIEEFNSQPKFSERIDYQCDIATPVQLTYDTQLMHSICSNIIHNSLKYSEGIVTLTLTETDESLVVVVQDKGIGIPEADLKRLFEPFHRARNVGTIQGTGLGLSITKQAIDAHGGTIVVDSQVNDGTTFTLSFPKETGEGA